MSETRTFDFSSKDTSFAIAQIMELSVLKWLVNKSFKSFFQAKCQTFDGSTLCNMRICWFFLSYIILNGICLGFGLLVGWNEKFQKKK